MVLEVVMMPGSGQTADRNQQGDRFSKTELALAPQMSSAGTQTDSAARANTASHTASQTVKPENAGWGPLFKNRETFLEMHIF